MSKINFEKVYMRNFLSIGNSGQEFDYKKGIHAVTGHVEPSLKRNGVGKSSILADSITFALFGKPLRKVNKEDIVNTVNNKDCVVKVDFTIDRNKYTVERSIKPTYLKIWENDEEVRFDSMKNTQSWLENKIKINFTCFSNIIVLNINHSRPFLDMDAKSKREVLEDILSLNIYSRMSEEAKKRHLDAKTNLKVYETEMTLQRKAYEQALINKKDIDSETKKFEEEKREKIINLEKELEQYESDLKKLLSKISTEDFTTKINEEKINLDRVVDLISTTKKDIALIKKEIKDSKEALETLEHAPYCPTCKTPTDNPIVKKYIEETKNSISSNNIKLKELTDKLTKADKVQNKLKNNIDKLHELEKQNNLVKTNIDKLEHKIDIQKTNIEHEKNRTLELSNIISESKIEELTNNMKSSEINFDNSVKQFNYNKVLRGILGEVGVRKYVMSKVLPYLNQKVNQYLQLLGSDYSLLFDSNLQEKIIARSREVRSYDSFSSGEKKRIDLSVLLSLMDVAKMQNSVDTNILILDEIIDSSMDSEGVENFLDFLSTGFREIYKDKAIYIITHRKEIGEGEYFNSMINLVKKNGFTRVENIIQLKD